MTSLSEKHRAVADRLISLINVPIPVSSESDDGLIEFEISDGWKVVVFYDCGGFDYVDSFVSPEGETIDFWYWPESSDRQKLIDWSPSQPPRGISKT